MSENDIKTDIMKLVQERARAGKPALTDQEILERWQRIRDGALA